MKPATVLAAIVVLFIAGCGGGVTGVPGGPPGTISGTVSTSTTLSTRAPTGRTDARVGPGPRRSPAGAPSIVPDQVLVKFRPGVSPAVAQESHRLAGGIEVKRSTKTGITLVRIASGESVNAVLSRYRGDPRIAYAEPNYIRYLAAAPRLPQVAPNDPLYSSQWHYGNVNLPAAWDVTTGSSLVIVAVIDTGILFNHPDLAGVTVAGFDFVDNDSNPQDTLPCPPPDDFAHGSHVAGTVAAATNNSVGVAGVNWGGPGKTKIMPLRIFGLFGNPPVCGAPSNLVIDAIEWAADHSARVINMSFGGTGASMAEQDAVDYAFDAGVTLVAAAGNANVNCSNFYPANYTHVIGVAATSLANTKASYSNFGTCIDLAAPGGEVTSPASEWVLSTAQEGGQPVGYYYSAGTSMASPHVAGLAGLLISKGVTGPANVENVMKTTATSLGAGMGSGLINAAAAVGASVTTHPVRVFSGTLSANAITRTSDIVNASPNGAYVVTNAQAGTWTVFAWQDTNGNGTIDGSDLYGSVGGIVVGTGGGPTGVNVSVKEVPTGSTPITVSGTRTGPAMARSADGG